jgi:hypothetical protein
MSNGDIQFEHIKESDFKELSPEHREWLLYKGVRSLSFTCHQRPAQCDKKYVRLRHVVLAAGFMTGVLVGLGVIQTKIILPHVVKAAIASVGLP